MHDVYRYLRRELTPAQVVAGISGTNANVDGSGWAEFDGDN